MPPRISFKERSSTPCRFRNWLSKTAVPIRPVVAINPNGPSIVRHPGVEAVERHLCGLVAHGERPQPGSVPAASFVMVALTKFVTQTLAPSKSPRRVPDPPGRLPARGRRWPEVLSSHCRDCWRGGGSNPGSASVRSGRTGMMGRGPRKGVVGGLQSSWHWLGPHSAAQALRPLFATGYPAPVRSPILDNSRRERRALMISCRFFCASDNSGRERRAVDGSGLTAWPSRGRR